MDNVQHIEQSASSGKMLRAMVGIGVLCAVLIVSTYEGTKPRIAMLKAEALEEAIFKVIPGAVTSKTFELTNQQIFILASGPAKPKKVVYAGYDKHNQLIGIAIEAQSQGYADIITLLYGYDPVKQTTIGFYVLESKETPGLGDKIMKDEGFLNNFSALDLSLSVDSKTIENKVITVKHGEKSSPWEIDGITGATISSRAVGEAIGNSSAAMLPLIQKNIDTFKNLEEHGK